MNNIDSVGFPARSPYLRTRVRCGSAAINSTSADSRSGRFYSARFDNGLIIGSNFEPLGVDETKQKQSFRQCSGTCDTLQLLLALAHFQLFEVATPQFRTRSQ